MCYHGFGARPLHDGHIFRDYKMRLQKIQILYLVGDRVRRKSPRLPGERILVHPILSSDEAFLPGFQPPGAAIHSNRQRFQDFEPFFQVKSELPEHHVNCVCHDLREPSPAAIIVQAADTEILFHDIAVL